MTQETQQVKPAPWAVTWWAMVLLSILIVSPLGAPVFLLGVTLGSQKLMTFWRRAAEGFAEGVLNGRPVQRQKPPPQKEPQKDPPKEVPKEAPAHAALVAVDYWQQAIDEKRLLSVVLMNNGNFHRFVRIPNEEGVPIRHDMAPIFKDELPDLGHEETGVSALEYTLRQIRAGVFDGTPFGRSIQQCTTAALVSLSPKLQAHEQDPAPKKLMPSASGEQDQPAAKSKAPQTATGIVITAQPRRVEPGDRAPYTVFSVVIKDHTHGEVSFNGMDLEEKFKSGAFEVGDTVTISKRVERFSVEVSGVMQPRSRGVFDVTVHKHNR